MAPSSSLKPRARNHLVIVLLFLAILCASFLVSLSNNASSLSLVSMDYNALLNMSSTSLLSLSTTSNEEWQQQLRTKDHELQMLQAHIRDLESRVSEFKEQASKKAQSLESLERLTAQKIQQAEARVHEMEERLQTQQQQLPSQSLSSVTTNLSEPLSQGGQESLLQMLQSLPVEQEEALWDDLHGREYQYRLTCPGHFDDPMYSLLNQTNSSILIGYHVGMVKNWRLIVKDQLQTLHACGLAHIADKLYIGYANNRTEHDELDDLQQILQRYPVLYNKTEFSYSNGQPVEGAAINALHAECQVRHPNTPFPPPHNDTLPAAGPPSDTVVFYFHTKGSSRHTDDWKEHMGARFLYPTALYWRKYMEYFTIERPHICLQQILQHQKWGCGVWWQPRRHFFGGNFWVASGRYLASMKALPVHNAKEEQHRWLAEGWITDELKALKSAEYPEFMKKFVSPSSPRAGLYKYLIPPSDFADYNVRWGPWWKGEQG